MEQRIQKEHQKQVILNEKAVQSNSLANPKEKGRSMVERHVIMPIKKYVSVLVRLVRMVKIAKINIRTIIVEQVC